MCFVHLRLGKENQRYTAQKMKFLIKDFFSKCDQIRSFLRICSHLLKKSLMEKFIFCERYFTIAFNNIRSEENLLPKGCWI